MMKLFAVVLLLAMVLFAGTSYAATEWNIEIDLQEDRTSNWVATYSFDEPVKNHDFFLLAGISSYNVTADGSLVDCQATKGVGTSIICTNVNAREIVYRVKTFSVVNKMQSFSLFSHRFAITQATDKFSLLIRLPFGTVLADKNDLAEAVNPFEPSFGQQSSDGRRIFVGWKLDSPKLGETYDYSVVYETPRQDDFTFFLFVIAVVVIAFVAFMFFYFRRGRVEDMLPILTENERKIMELVIKDKEIDQRKIVKETDFSKAKVSRIIHDLEKRGLVEKTRKGRKNLIKVKRRKKIRKRGEE